MREQFALRRYETLAAAVVSHRARVARSATGARPHDDALYQRLRQIAESDRRVA